MPNTYQISIVNKSGVSQSYLLFAAVPVVQTGASSSGQVFQNVFMAAPPIASRPDGSSSTTFTITRQFYGICGTSVQNLAAGVQVATSDYEAVTLGAGNNPGTTLDFTTVGGAQFTIPLPPETAPAGGYIISTDSSFQLPDPSKATRGSPLFLPFSFNALGSNFHPARTSSHTAQRLPPNTQDKSANTHQTIPSSAWAA